MLAILSEGNGSYPVNTTLVNPQVSNSSIVRYKPVTEAPANVTPADYSTLNTQMVLTGTDATNFNQSTQIALLNALNDVLVTNGYNDFYLGIGNFSVSLSLVSGGLSCLAVVLKPYNGYLCVQL